MRKKFRELSGDLSDANCIRFIQELSVTLDQPIVFDDQLETKSNLFPNVLSENCQCVCLPYNQVEANRHRLAALVSRRNDIAHGKNAPVKSLGEYQEHENAAFTVMYELAITIIEAIEQKRYLK
jgi:hypothetical protein